MFLVKTMETMYCFVQRLGKISAFTELLKREEKVTFMNPLRHRLNTSSFGHHARGFSELATAKQCHKSPITGPHIRLTFACLHLPLLVSKKQSKPSCMAAHWERPTLSHATLTMPSVCLTWAAPTISERGPFSVWHLYLFCGPPVPLVSICIHDVMFLNASRGDLRQEQPFGTPEDHLVDQRPYYLGIDGISALLFSVETQRTIGYGSHIVSPTGCPAGYDAVHCWVHDR